MGIPTMICGGNNIPHLRRELAAYIQQGGYQLIHCHGCRANMIGALLQGPTGLPVVSTVHSDYRLDYMGHPSAISPSAPSTPLPCGGWTTASVCPTPWWTCSSTGLSPRPVLRHLQRHRLHPCAVSGGPAGLSPGTGGRRGGKQRGGGHRRPAEPRQGYVHPDPGLCGGTQVLPPAAAGHRRGRREGQAGGLAAELGVERSPSPAGSAAVWTASIPRWMSTP